MMEMILIMGLALLIGGFLGAGIKRMWRYGELEYELEDRKRDEWYRDTPINLNSHAPKIKEPKKEWIVEPYPLTEWEEKRTRDVKKGPNTGGLTLTRRLKLLQYDEKPLISCGAWKQYRFDVYEQFAKGKDWNFGGWAHLSVPIHERDRTNKDIVHPVLSGVYYQVNPYNTKEFKAHQMDTCMPPAVYGQLSEEDMEWFGTNLQWSLDNRGLSKGRIDKNLHEDDWRPLHEDSVIKPMVNYQ